MTDLENFVALYKSFGVECVVNHRSEYYREQEFGERIQFGDAQVILLGSGYEYKNGKYTDSKMFDGYPGFHSDVVFNKDGKFIGQGFWE